MHWALKRAGLEGRVRVVGAYDLNDAANRTYRHNFPDTPVRSVPDLLSPAPLAQLFIPSLADRPLERRGIWRR